MSTCKPPTAILFATLIQVLSALIIGLTLGFQEFNDFGGYDELEPIPKLYLNYSLAYSACRMNRGCERTDKFNEVYLRHCSRYRFDSLLSNGALETIMHDSPDECERVVRDFILLDEQINRYDQNFTTLLTRYNCHNGYSVKWNCEDCKVSKEFCLL